MWNVNTNKQITDFEGSTLSKKSLKYRKLNLLITLVQLQRMLQTTCPIKNRIFELKKFVNPFDENTEETNLGID